MTPARSRTETKRKSDRPLVWIRYDDESVRELPVEDVRLADFAGSVPWRRVRSVHGQPHYSGTYASATMRGPVVYESRLELARLLLADFDPAVSGIHAQPCLLASKVDGRVRRNVPDFMLASTAGTALVVNVKPAGRLDDPKVVHALAWPREVIERHGWGYEIWSGADPVVVANVRFLAGYRRVGSVPEADIERAWVNVCDGDQLAVAERRLAGELPRCVARPALMALLWSGWLTTDLSRPLEGDSVLRRAG